MRPKKKLKELKNTLRLIEQEINRIEERIDSKYDNGVHPEFSPRTKTEARALKLYNELERGLKYSIEDCMNVLDLKSNSGRTITNRAANKLKELSEMDILSDTIHIDNEKRKRFIKIER